MWSLTITSFFCKFRIEKFLIPFGALLYLIGMLTKYPIGLPLHPDLIDSLHSPIFVAVGRWFSMYHEKNKKLALALFFGGAMMHFAEIILLKEMYNYSASNIKDISFLLGTFLWGIGAFLLCLEYPNAGKDTILERIGKLTLGIYVSHILIIWALMPFSALFKSLVWEIFKPVPALLISYCLCQGIARNRIFGKFLT
jgi:surface polysaccharide O-acyltransferase-like enzyme